MSLLKHGSTPLPPPLQVNAALDAAMSARDRTVVVIAHRLSTVRHADVIVVMDKGQVRRPGKNASSNREKSGSPPSL